MWIRLLVRFYGESRLTCASSSVRSVLRAVCSRAGGSARPAPSRRPVDIKDVCDPAEWWSNRNRRSPCPRGAPTDPSGRGRDPVLSARRAADGAARATVVALHGGGMSAGYFDGQAHPDLSLLTLGARLGFTVLAVDRPGYGLSAGSCPAGRPSPSRPTCWSRPWSGSPGSTPREPASSCWRTPTGASWPWWRPHAGPVRSPWTCPAAGTATTRGGRTAADADQRRPAPQLGAAAAVSAGHLPFDRLDGGTHAGT